LVGATTTSYLYDKSDIVQELSGSTPIANLVKFGLDAVLTRSDAGGMSSFLEDGLGSTLALTDSSGNIQTQYSYDPFGQTTVTGAVSANTHQYTGRENDGASLYYYRARYYKPIFSRFISEDPLDFEGGDTNLYSYVANAPLDSVDPTGAGFINCAAALAELAKAVSDLQRRQWENQGKCSDKGHDKAIEQYKNRVRNALEKAKHCLTKEEIREYEILLGLGLVIVLVPELLPAFGLGLAGAIP